MARTSRLVRRPPGVSSRMTTSSTSSSSKRASRLTAGARLHSSRRAVSLSQAARLGADRGRACARGGSRRYPTAMCAVLTAQGSVTFCARVGESERLLLEGPVPVDRFLLETSEVGLVAVPCVPAMHLPWRRGNVVGSRATHCVGALLVYQSVCWLRALCVLWPDCVLPAGATRLSSVSRGSGTATALVLPAACTGHRHAMHRAPRGMSHEKSITRQRRAAYPRCQRPTPRDAEKPDSEYVHVHVPGTV